MEPTNVGVELITAIISFVIVIIPSWMWGVNYLKKREAIRIERSEKEADFIQKINNIDSLVLDIDKELRRHMAQFSADIKLSDKPIFICHPDGRWKDVNPALTSIFGTTKEQMLGFGWANCIVDSERDHALSYWRSAVSSDIDTTFIYSVYNKITDSMHKFEYRVIIIRDSNDNIIHIVGTVKKLKDNENKSKLP